MSRVSTLKMIVGLCAAISALDPLSGRGAEANLRIVNRDAGCSVLNESELIKQLKSFPAEPGSIADKHFVLEEHEGALRERALADIVLERVDVPEIRQLGVVVRDGHQLGIDKLRSIAAALKVTLPCNLSPLEEANLEAIRALSPEELVRFFLIRQRVMHAWDITIFTDYAAVAKNDQLRRYISETLPPLRSHAELVVRLSNARGIRGGLATVGN